MLELLVKYAQENDLVTEPGFAPKDIRWAIVIDGEGNYVDVIELGDTESKRNRGQRFKKCPEFSQPEMVRGGIKKSHFLAETVNVVTLYGKGASNPKIMEKHTFFIQLLKEAGTAMPELLHAAQVLTDDHSLESIRESLKAAKARETDKITFRIAGRFPLETDAWHDWWRHNRRDISKAKGGVEELAPCLATGEFASPVMTHPKIKGLADVGGNTQGDVLIGFDKESFRSYGLEQSANATVSEAAASAYRAALNHLIENHSQRLAGVKVVHWFKEKISPADDPLSWLEEGQGEQELQAQELARSMLDSIRSGQRPDLQNNYFYALTLSGASGRVMVRDWMEGRFENLVKNIISWFDDLSIVSRDGNSLANSPKFFAVLGATVRNPGDLSSPCVAGLWRSAINAEPIPRSALASSLYRAKIDIIKDEPFNHARMGLIKAFHQRKYRQIGGAAMAEILKPELDEDHPNPAYQCGRLMAVLARLQRSALGDVGAGVVQRYYAAASATPSLVLGRLTRTSQYHLNKLEPGLAQWFDQMLADIWGKLRNGVPKTLSLEEQSLFALGYYQQIGAMRKQKEDRPESEKEVSDG